MPDNTRPRDRAGVNRTTGILRSARATTEQEGQDTRTAMGRSQHASRGSFVNYYDDLGVSTTPTQAATVREEESKFQSKVKEQQGIVNSKRKELESAYAAGQQKLSDAWSSLPDIPGYKDAVGKAWSSTKKSFVPVAVIDKSNNVEGTYYLPKESADALIKAKGLYGVYNDKQNTYYVSTRAEGGATIGQELHDALRGAETETYVKWYEAAAPKIQQQLGVANKQMSEAKGVLNKAGTQLNEQYSSSSSSLAAAEAQLKATVDARAAEWKTLRDNYEKKKATISEIFSNMKVEAPKEKA